MVAWWIWVIIGIAAFASVGLAYLFFFRGVRHARFSVEVRRDDSLRLEVKATDTAMVEKLIKALEEYDSSQRLKDPVLAVSDEALCIAARNAVKKGLLMFNVPSVMTQGETEKIEVRIARSVDLHDELLAEMRGNGEPQSEEIDTSLYMEVTLSGQAFEIKSQGPAEQLIIPEPAHWEFDVLPRRAGHQQLTIHVNMRIEAEGIRGGRRGVSSHERQVDVQVNLRFAASRFALSNWQWLIPTILALTGVIAAWLVVPF